MAKAIIARRLGDTYQARFILFHLLGLRTNDYYKEVTFEHDRVSFVDDVAVTYWEPLCDRTNGNRIISDYYQCKYHVSQGGAFTHNSLIDPSFIHSKGGQTMLKRLYDAYLKLSFNSNQFRLYIVSNWRWHPNDILAPYISEGRIRINIFEQKPTSKAGLVLQKYYNHLGADKNNVQRFFEHLRFGLGKDLTDLNSDLEPRLKLANLKPIDPTTSSSVYDDLVWKWYEQGRNTFSKISFDDIVQTEKLLIKSSNRYSEIIIRSFLVDLVRPKISQAGLLELYDLFKGRFPQKCSYWNKEIPSRIESFLRKPPIHNLQLPLHLFFDCHLSICYLFGYLIRTKFRNYNIIPAQISYSSGFELWPEPSYSDDNLWKIEKTKTIEREAVIAVSVTASINKPLHQYLRSNKMKHLPIVHLSPINKPGPKAVINGDHAWHLGFEIQTLIKRTLPTSCKTIHLFLSCPSALAYILGNTLCQIVPEIQLYEYDFEGFTHTDSYYPSIRLPIKGRK